MSATMEDLREQAKELGINTFGMKKTEIEYAIAEKQGMSDPPVDEPDTLFGEPAVLETPAAPPVDQATMIAMMAVKYAKEASEQLAAMQQPVAQKQGTPEEVIAKRHESDRQTIAKMQKVSVFIPGGYPGAPKVYTSVVNGHKINIKPDTETMVPLAHAENIKMSFKQASINMKSQEKLEKATQMI